MEKFIKENWFKLGILVIFLICGILFLIFFSDSNLKKDAFCAGFKEQATERIRTWYASGDTNNISPKEIFYSKKNKQCIVLWDNIERTPADNGWTITKVIFDPITNENIYSHNSFYFDDKELNEDTYSFYEDFLKDVRN